MGISPRATYQTPRACTTLHNAEWHLTNSVTTCLSGLQFVHDKSEIAFPPSVGRRMIEN